MQIDYLWAPRHFDLVPNLQEYYKSVALLLPEKEVTYITFAGFWEDQSEVPADYLETLDMIRSRAKLLILIGVPTVRTSSNIPAFAKPLQLKSMSSNLPQLACHVEVHRGFFAPKVSAPICAFHPIAMFKLRCLRLAISSYLVLAALPRSEKGPGFEGSF